MSSLEANAYTTNPSVQLASAITLSKPIITGNILSKTPAVDSSQQATQPKKIQPIQKPVLDLSSVNTNRQRGTAPTLFHSKNLHKAPPASVNADFNPLEVHRKISARELMNQRKPVVEAKKSEIPNRFLSTTPLTQQRNILAVPNKQEVMGNDQTRMQSQNLGVTGSQTPNSVIQHIPSYPAAVTVAMITQTTSSANSAAPPMSSIIKTAGSADSRAIVSSEGRSAPTQAIPSVPRVVSTSSSRTITGSSGNIAPGMRTNKVAQHTAVIQPAVKTQPQTMMRQVQPMRGVTTPQRPFSSSITPGSAHTTQSPTTVQITIHQPKNTPICSGANSADRGVSATAHPPALSGSSNHVTFGASNLVSAPIISESPGVSQGAPLQKLVISQTPTGVIQQNKTLLPSGMDSGRGTASMSLGNTVRKTRPIIGSSTGQHDYVRSDPQPLPNTTTRKPDNPGQRPAMSLHTIPDNAAVNTHAFYPALTSSINYPASPYVQTASMSPSAHSLKTYPNMSAAQTSLSTAASNSTSNPTAAAALLSTPTKQQSSGNTDFASLEAQTSHAVSPRPSILRKRPHENSVNTVVVKKIVPNNEKLVNTNALLSSQPASPGRFHSVAPSFADKDNASQSSTDTALSSESPPLTHLSVKHEPVEHMEVNGAFDSLPGDQVSPRKKPRKQLLNTAAELKEQYHDSSTEEETETKMPTSCMQNSLKYETEEQNTPSPIKDEFVDKDGVKWVKMRQRQADALMCFYNCTWKSCNNHFQRHSDIKVKEERRPVVSELSNQKSVMQKASGWKFYHISAQFQEMIDAEESLDERLTKLQELLPQKSRQNNHELSKLFELAQANKQRCNLTRDQLQEAKTSMFSILDTHKSVIVDIIHKHRSKRPVKKKERSL